MSRIESKSQQSFPTFGRKPGEYITNIDTSLRDGLQSRRYALIGKPTLTIDERISLVSAMYDVGVRTFEVFSPNVNALEKESLAALREHANNYPEKDRPRLNAHVRCHYDDFHAAIDGGVDGVHVYMGVAQHAGHQKSPLEVADRVGRILGDVRASHPDLYIRYSTEDAFRSEVNDRNLAFDAAEPYVQTFGIPDTVGVATDDFIRQIIKEMRDRYPNTHLEGHFHADSGETLHNAITSAKYGISFIDTTIWGWAERTGITSFGNLLVRLHKLNPALLKDFNLNLTYKLNKLMSKIAGVPIPESELVSEDSTTHAAGVHTDAVIKNPDAYRSIDFSVFGVPENQFILTPYVGWHHIQQYLSQRGYSVSDHLAQAITNAYKDETPRMNKNNSCESVLKDVAARFLVGSEYNSNKMRQVS